ncbi:MAG: hypothetical protein AAGL11_10370 [Pseudomonadota bacterium]
MWILFRSMSTASAKIIATFFMVLVLIMLGIMFAPAAFNGVNDFANYLANLDWVRNPDLGEQGVAVTRVFINESSIFGIVMTLIARIVVEIIWWGTGALWTMVNPPEPDLAATAPAPAGEEKPSYYN